MLFLLLKNECDAIALGSNQVEVEVQWKNEFQIWSVTYDYTLSYQKWSQYLKS
jgi:hypothetical protein